MDVDSLNVEEPSPDKTLLDSKIEEGQAGTESEVSGRQNEPESEEKQTVKE